MLRSAFLSPKEKTMHGYPSFLGGFQSPCKDLLFPHGLNLVQKPLYLVHVCKVLKWHLIICIHTMHNLYKMLFCIILQVISFLRSKLLLTHSSWPPSITNNFLVKVIPLFCIAHPYCAWFMASLARARARAHWKHGGFDLILSSVSCKMAIAHQRARAPHLFFQSL